MDEQIKAKITVAAIDALFTKGLPAMAKLITSLNNKDEVTLEDIRSVRGDLDAEDYFTE